MNISTLPDDLCIHIIMGMTYETLLNIMSLNVRFNMLLRSEVFWRQKAILDFEVTGAEYNTICSDISNCHNIAPEAYIKISATNDIYVPRAEKYASLDRLTAFTIKRDKFAHFKYLISKYGNPGIMTLNVAYRDGRINTVMN